MKLGEMISRFQKADLDGNGRLDRDELEQMLKTDNQLVRTQGLWLNTIGLDALMDMYDKDKSGTIEFEEFKNMVYDGLLLDGMLDQYYQAFHAVDTSGNGSIGASELAQMLAACGVPVSYEKLVTIMQKFDKDESGQIEFGEFLLMFKDQELLELSDVLKYISVLPKEGSGGSTSFQPLVGEVTPIFSEMELDEALEQTKGTGKIVLVFCALTWCRSCKGMQRPMQKLAAQYKDQAVFIKLFGNSNSQTKLLFKDRLKVRSTPSFIIFKDGKMLNNLAGGSKERVETTIRESLGSSGLPDVLYPPVEGEKK